jgi:hypothetical protein
MGGGDVRFLYLVLYVKRGSVALCSHFVWRCAFNGLSKMYPRTQFHLRPSENPWTTTTTTPQHARIRSPIRFQRRNRLKLLVGVLFAVFVLYEHVLPRADFDFHIPGTSSGHAICPSAPVIDDILVVIRTGATEAPTKLPVHFDTTLHCIPNSVIYSDYAETIAGHHVYDVLDEVSATLKASAPEFELYEQMKLHGRDGMNVTEHFGSGPAGSENPAWKLDKFKFLPMVDKAFRHAPEAKWFVFIEADTYLMWANLVAYLSMLDPKDDLYLGNPMYIGDVLFAHGGSGFVISQAAMRKVTEHRSTRVAEYDKYTAENWAGDMVLGKALKDVGVEMMQLFPHFQGDPVSSFNHFEMKQQRSPWCYAPMTYHHMRKGEIQRLWAFEKAWRRKGLGLLAHRDIFKEYLVPKFTTEIDDWDNVSIDAEPIVVTSLEACHAVCQAKTGCLQYSYMAGTCSTTTEVRYGNEAHRACTDYSGASGKCESWREQSQPGDTVQSGWMMERLLEHIKEKDSSCHETEDEMWVIKG